MMPMTVRLDPNVEIVDDDKGRIVLLPKDSRDPVRLAASDRQLIEHLRDGYCDLEGRSADAVLSESQRSRFNSIAVALDRSGLLADRRVMPAARTVRFPVLTAVFDTLASWLTRPFVATLPVRMRGVLLQLLTAAIVAGLVTLWWSTGGRMFASVITPYWWAGFAVFLLLFPILHEFSHALAGRLFGLQITSVGAQSRGGLAWSPFVEVRRAVLSSDPTVRIWIPLIGVVCNLFLVLIASLCLWSAEPGSALAGIAGMLVALLHVRVLVDGGFGVRTDASQALRIAEELLPPARFLRVRWLVRGGSLVFLLCSLCMIALSFNTSGAPL